MYLFYHYKIYFSFINMMSKLHPSALPDSSVIQIFYGTVLYSISSLIFILY
jgi:hypothetical protein